MSCNVCGQNKVTTAYRINKKRFSICRECMKGLHCAYLEQCPNCLVSTIVNVDTYCEMPRAIICHCGNCMKGG